MQPFPSSSDFKFLLKWLQLITHIFHAVLGIYNCNSYSCIVLMLRKSSQWYAFKEQYRTFPCLLNAGL